MRRFKRISIIIIAAALILAALGAGGYRLMNSRDSQIFGEIVSHVDTGKKVISLTFDDGPTDKTPGILSALDELGVKCTFFLTGAQMEQNMDYARAIAEAGHQIGNHSYSHKMMIFKSWSFIENEIDETNALIREVGYDGDIVFRPPYCKKLVLLPLALNQRGMTTVTFDVEPDSYPDVASTPEGITEYVLAQTECGSIILLHLMYDSGNNALAALPGIVQGLRDDGYEFVTVNELLDLHS